MTQKNNVITVDTPKWFMPFFEKKMFKGIAGGRGSGKSHIVSERLTECVIAEKCDLVCIREKQKTLEFSAKKLIESKIYALGLRDFFYIQYKVIKTVFGNVIIFEGMANHTSDSIKSLEGFKYGWVEEAQNLSHKSLDLLLPTIRANDGELWFTWNPRDKKDPVDKMFIENFDEKIMQFTHVNYDKNPWFPNTLKVQMEYMRTRDVEKYAHIWLGQYKNNTESQVFKNWTIEEFEAPRDAIFRLGADWGYSVDPTVAIRCYINGKNLYIDYEAYRIGCEITDIPELFMTIPQAEKWNMCADSSRPETISYLNNNGFPKIVYSKKGAGSIEDGIAFLQSYNIVVHPRCVKTIEELSTYAYKSDKMTGETLPILEDKNNHVIDALRYATEALRRAEKTQEINIAIPKLNTHW